MPQLDGASSNPVRSACRKLRASVILLQLQIVIRMVSALRAVRKRFRIEFVDIGEQFAERARAVIEQALAFLRGCLGGIAGGAARVKVLGLPRKRCRPV